MIKSLIPDIAFSLMRARMKHTIVAAVGVTFSITMFITLLSFMNGLNTLLDDLILNRTPHIRLYNEIKPSSIQPSDLAYQEENTMHIVRSVKPGINRKALHNAKAIVQSLQSNKDVWDISPKVSSQVFYTTGSIELTGLVHGVDALVEKKMFRFDDYIVEGNSEDINILPNSIILGKGVAEKLLVTIGDFVQITSSNGNSFSLRIVGFFQSGLAEVDKIQSFTSIATAQKIMGQPASYINELHVKLHDLNKAPRLTQQFRILYNCDAEDIQTANAQFYTGSSIRSLISYAVGITLLIVSGFGIYNILNMMIYEKMDTIAILKATGFSGNDVKNIFITIAVSIGFFGGLFGLIFGFGLSVIIDNIPFVTAALPTTKTFPIDYNIKYYIIGSVFSLLTTYLAGWFPARKASKIDPVIIIRGK